MPTLHPPPPTSELEPPAIDSTRNWLAVSWPFLLGTVFVLLLALASEAALLGVRAFGTGQNIWSIARKQATFDLLHHLSTGSPQALTQYHRTQDILQKLQEGRRAMEGGSNADQQTARRAFEAVGVDPRDIAYGLWVNRWFGWTPQYQNVLAQWVQAEKEVAAFESLRIQLAESAGAPPLSADVLASVLERLQRQDERVATYEKSYIDSLVDLSHVVFGIVALTHVVLALLLVVGVLSRTRAFLHHRQTVERELASERRRAAVTLASIADAVISTNAQGELVFANEAARRLGGRSTPTGASMSPKRRVSDIIELARGSGNLGRTLLNHEVLSGRKPSAIGSDDDVVCHPDGRRIPVTWVAAPIRDGDRTDGAVVVLRDVTREREMLDNLGWLASHDSLTELPNRRAFEQALQALLNSQPLVQVAPEGGALGGGQGGAHPALLFVDLDQFKIVNDTCGHAAGDELLRQVAMVMKQALRPGDVLARTGGDEFGVLLEAANLAQATVRAENLRERVTQMTFHWGLRRFSPTVSIGLVHLLPAQWQLASALSAADVTCYVAKDRGRNRVEVYDPLSEHMSSRFGEMAWVQRLQSALSERRFVLYAQPIVALGAQCSEGYGGGTERTHLELLLRLYDEANEITLPGVFMGAAERFGMMPLIDHWVLDEALSTIAQRQAAGTDQPNTLYSVNLSGDSFGEEGFLHTVKLLFDKHRVDHRSLCFEITETQAVTNFNQAVRFITELRSLGCKFALDDFGAGMSSFSYIKHLPVDYLKIDGLFVRDMLRNPIDRAIVEMSNHLAHAMGIETIGEYAESPEVIAALRDIGVDHAQGYGIARPQPFSAKAAVTLTALAMTAPAVT